MIGGLKEKLLAAKMAHIEKVLVPDKNRPDVEELSKEITKGMDIIYVKEMEDVIQEAFVTGCAEDEAADRERDASSAALAEAAATVAVKPERKGKP